MKTKKSLKDKVKNGFATIGLLGTLAHTFVIPHESSFTNIYQGYVSEKENKILVFDEHPSNERVGNASQYIKGNPEDYIIGIKYNITQSKPIIDIFDLKKITDSKKIK